MRGDLRAGVHPRGRARITDVRGNPDDPLSRGHICPKAVALQDVHEDPDRLRRPMKRVSTGSTDATWQEISWDEALDLVADNLARTVNEHGRDALAIYLGNPNVHSLGSMTHGTAMVRSFRTRNRYSATSVDQLPAQMLAYLMFGHQLLLPVPDLDRTRLFLVFGAQPDGLQRQPDDGPRLPRAAASPEERGGRMVVVDPRRTETAKVAHEHHFVRPGTDAFVLLAMLQVLFAEGLAAPRRTSTGSTPCVRRSRRSPPSAPRRCRAIAADDVRRLARESRPPRARRSTDGWVSRRRSSGSSPPGPCSCSTW